MDYVKMDYVNEYKKLNLGGNAWKPEMGMHKVVVLGEPEECEFVDEVSGRVTPQIKLRVSVNLKEFDWFVTKGVTTQSLYGQIIAIGVAKNKLSGELLTVLVNRVRGNDNKLRNSYTVQEALEVIKELEKSENSS